MKHEKSLTGTSLREARLARGQTMEEVAAELHVSLRTMWRWEQGNVPNRLGQDAIRAWLTRTPVR